ncbi:hypothetical protein [Streptomyces sp. NPDC045251]|uniref:hypothetical protein n=1 Tax=unclassified Streptomyces TaxID=2593676 RepID=UPI0033CBF028
MAFLPRFALSVAACGAALTALLAAQSSAGAPGERGRAASDMGVTVVQTQNDLSWG